MPTPTAKRPKRRHAKAISEWKKWLEANPDASQERKFKAFDAYVDSAAFAEQLENDSGK